MTKKIAPQAPAVTFSCVHQAQMEEKRRHDRRYDDTISHMGGNNTDLQKFWTRNDWEKQFLRHPKYQMNIGKCRALSWHTSHAKGLHSWLKKTRNIPANTPKWCTTSLIDHLPKYSSLPLLPISTNNYKRDKEKESFMFDQMDNMDKSTITNTCNCRMSISCRSTYLQKSICGRPMQ